MRHKALAAASRSGSACRSNTSRTGIPTGRTRETRGCRPPWRGCCPPASRPATSPGRRQGSCPVGPLMNYGYEGKLLLPVPVSREPVLRGQCARRQAQRAVAGLQGRVHSAAGRLRTEHSGAGQHGDARCGLRGRAGGGAATRAWRDGRGHAGRRGQGDARRRQRPAGRAARPRTGVSGRDGRRGRPGGAPHLALGRRCLARAGADLGAALREPVANAGRAAGPRGRGRRAGVLRHCRHVAGAGSAGCRPCRHRGAASVACTAPDGAWALPWPWRCSAACCST